MLIVLKSGSLNFLEPSGPVQACNGIALRYLLCRLRVFENRVLRRIFGPKRDEVTRERRKLHNEELNDLYSSPNFVRV